MIQLRKELEDLKKQHAEELKTAQDALALAKEQLVGADQRVAELTKEDQVKVDGWTAKLFNINNVLSSKFLISSGTTCNFSSFSRVTSLLRLYF